MKLTEKSWGRAAMRLALCVAMLCLAGVPAQIGRAQALTTTTVQGTVYLANGMPGAGTLTLTWPSFTTAAGQLVTADKMTVSIPADGFVSVNLAPNLGSTPAGQYYTAVFNLSDGSVTTQYWVVPAAAQASLAQVQAQVMPAAQAVQAVSKTYVDQTVAQAIGSQLTVSGGNLTGPLYLSGDPTQPLQAADKHYVDVSFSAATAAATLSNILPGAASDGNNGLSLAGNVAAAQMVSKNSPVTDIRAYGAKTDGSTDVSAAINSAINSCPNTFGSTPGGLSCRILLPCGGVGCYLSDASNLAAAPGGTQIEIDLQGKLILGSTLTLPDNMDLVAKGGGAGGQFQWGGAAAQLVSPSARGTVGTAITSTNAPVTITPAFSSGSIANLPVNSAITIAGTTTCSASASRAANGVVTLTYSAYCRIPAGATVNISSCSDATFNSANAVLQSTDYPGQTATWNSSTSSAASATGCSVTGFNDDDFETVRVYCSNGNADSGYSCGAGQITVVPAQTHSASDLWGEVAVAPPGNTFSHHVMEGISVTGCQGACLFLEHIGVFRYSNDSFRSAQAITSIPADIYSSFSGNFDNDVFFGMTDWGCNSNCSTASNPASFRCTLETGYLNNSGDGTCGGLVFLQDSWVVGEIKTDTNGLTSISGHPASLALPVMRNLIVEQPRQFVVEEDSRNTGGQGTDVTLTNVFPQDNFNVQAYVACTDEGCGKATAIVNNFSNINTRNVVNNYWQGNVQSDHADEQINWPYGRYAPVGVFTGDGQIKAEISNVGANFAPSVIPYATQNLPTDLGSWTAFGGASIVTGILAPDGSTNAVDVIQGSGNGLYYTTGYNGGTSAGDVFLFGGWTRPGVNETRTGNPYYSATFRLSSGGTDSFQPSGGSGSSSQPFELNMPNASWRPVVALAVIKTGEASTHQITMQLLAGSANGAGNDFFAPFVIYIPASAGIPMAEIERWRQELLHGYVPPGMSGPGIALDPSLKLFLNPSVDLYASGSQLQTDETFQAAALKSTANGCNSTAAYMKYDGTCGNGAAGGSLVPTVATVAPATTTSLTGTNGTFTTTTSAGQYRVCAWFDNLVAATAGYYYFYIQYTSDGHGFTTTIIGNTSGSTQWTTGHSCYNFYADASTSIRWGLGTSGLTGTPTERYTATLEQLQ